MENVVFADERGVWSIGSRGKPYGIEWGSIACVSGHKLDGITEVYLCIELDFEYGEFFELNDSMSGFTQVVAAIGERLPGLATDWFEKLQGLSLGDAPLEVWKNAQVWKNAG